MMKNILRFLLLLIPVVSSVVIDCKFNTFNYTLIGNVNQCQLNQNPLITSLGMVVTEATGFRNTSRADESVKCFSSFQSHAINYFPRGLTNIFPNLIAIYIYYGRVKEIHQDDLREYTKLQYLYLHINDIKYLEKDLFKFNSELRYLRLSQNEIKKIHPTAFDGLNQLEYLDLSSNECVTGEAKTKSEVLKLIQKAKDECPIFVTIGHLHNVTSDHKIQIDEKSAKIENLTAQFKKMEEAHEANNESIKVLFLLTLPSICFFVALIGIMINLYIKDKIQKKSQTTEMAIRLRPVEDHQRQNSNLIELENVSKNSNSA